MSGWEGDGTGRDRGGNGDEVFGGGVGGGVVRVRRYVCCMMIMIG